MDFIGTLWYNEKAGCQLSWLERLVYTEKVGGSSPSQPTRPKKRPKGSYFDEKDICGIIILMSKNDKIIKIVESNFALEGMKFSNREKKIMKDCLSGKTSFDSAIKNVIARYKRAQMTLSYEYERDDYYCYPDSKVLRNKLNIEDEKNLETAEREITSLKAVEFVSNPFPEELDFNYIKKLHKFWLNRQNVLLLVFIKP